MEYDSDHVLQIVTKSRILADKSSKQVFVLCIGKYIEEKFKTLIAYGADNVVVCEGDEVRNLRVYSDIACEAIEAYMPSVILVPASLFGKGVAALLSIKLDAGLTADCIDINVDEENVFSFSRAAINDSVIAKIQCINCNINLCTVKKGVFAKQPYSGKTGGRISKYEWVQKTEYPKEELLISAECKAEEEIDINKYQIVFCIGRGVKNEETREKVEKLAARLHAGVIGTRAVVEEYNMNKARQVGQSGKSISPRIYIGLGVLGASQHMVGIKRAEIIIAVNTDKNAAIFDYADYSIIEDVGVFIEAMENEVNKEEDICGF